MFEFGVIGRSSFYSRELVEMLQPFVGNLLTPCEHASMLRVSIRHIESERPRGTSHMGHGAASESEAGLMKPIEFLVLAVLKSGSRHGYGIVQELGERTEGRVRVRPGNLYRVLDRLLERGLLEIAERRPAKELNDERRTYYRITAAGKRALAT